MHLSRRRINAISGCGFDPQDAGPLPNAKILEDMVKVWFELTRVHGRGVGFALSKG
jgi:predicted dinucleotide-binding enzyme